MNVVEIITKYLKDNGFDGLYNPGECACLVDDLMPCDGGCAVCEPGYKSECDGMDCPLDGECDWHIGPDKEDTAQQLDKIKREEE